MFDQDYDSAYVYRFLGVSYFQKKDYKESIKSFESGLSVLEDVSALETNENILLEIQTGMARFYYNRI